MKKNSRIKTAIIGVGLGLGLLFGLGTTPAIAQETNKENLVRKSVYTYYSRHKTEIQKNNVYTIIIGIMYEFMDKDLNPVNWGVIALAGDKRYPDVETKGIIHYNMFDPTMFYEHYNDVNPIIKELTNKILAEEAYKYIPLKKPKEKPDMGRLIDDLIEALLAERIEI